MHISFPRRGGEIASTLAIIAVSALLGMLIDWRAPGINRYARDWLMRARGTLSVPDDIALVAIDEPSMARFGRFPWPRSVIARAIDGVAAGQPKAIALNVLYTDPANNEEDASLARSIAQAGNVILAAQLVESQPGATAASWLLPLPPLGRAAAAIGHVNVLTESEGVARELLVRAADDTGRFFRAMPIEAVRIGERVPEEAVVDTGGALLIRSRVIPVNSSAPAVVFGGGAAAQVVRAGRMAIDYIGPTGSFSANTYSVLEVVEGRVPPARFRGRYVLIGATAASVGQSFSSPFVHQADVEPNQHGTLMPGVEVLANALNTILRSRFYSRTPDGLALLWAALVAALTLVLLSASQGRYALLKQISVLGGVAGAVILTSYVSFAWFLVIPPLAPGLISFASAGLLGLMRRSLITSSRLDASIAELARAGDLLKPESAPKDDTRTWRWPEGLEGKAGTLGRLNTRLLERTRFVDLAMRSVEDGLIIADPDGRITFANSSAAGILESTGRALMGRNLFERLAECELPPSSATREILPRLLLDRAPVEREITIRGSRPRQFTLRLAAVYTGESPVLGIVASLSDITRQKELQQTKNDVISLVSHEMRTPLAAIQGMSELLANYDLDPARRREMNVAINDEAKRLTRMITEYLDITRLESGITSPWRSPVRVASFLERTLLLLEPIAAKRGIRLERSWALDLPPVLADPDLLSRAAENLMSNAVKYSPPGTTVTVSARSDASSILIEVADQGYGIPAEDLDRVFEKFYRVPRIQDADVGGTGLGLAMVREIAELHGGSVAVKSEVNAGSTFTLTIPLEPVKR